MEKDTAMNEGKQPIPGMDKRKSKRESLYLIEDDLLKENPKSKNKEHKKPPSEKLMIRLGFLDGEGAGTLGDLVSEEGLAFSLFMSAFNSNNGEQLNVDYKTWWIGDCVAKAIINEYEIVFEEELRKILCLSEEELEHAENHLRKLEKNYPSAYAKQVPCVFITSEEIRAMIKQDKPSSKIDKISNAELHKMVKEFVRAPYERRTRRKPLADDKTRYVRLGHFNLHPKGFYELMGGCQLIYRAIVPLPNPVNIELDKLCWIAQVETKNRTRKCRQVEGYLNELIAAGYISSWKKRFKKIEGKREKEIWYIIIKPSRIPLS